VSASYSVKRTGTPQQERGSETSPLLLNAQENPHVVRSMSSIIDLNRGVGMRERWSSKVSMSSRPRKQRSPTKEAMSLYLSFEKLIFECRARE